MLQGNSLGSPGDDAPPLMPRPPSDGDSPTPALPPKSGAAPPRRPPPPKRPPPPGGKGAPAPPVPPPPSAAAAAASASSNDDPFGGGGDSGGGGGFADFSAFGSNQVSLHKIHDNDNNSLPGYRLKLYNQYFQRNSKWEVFL